MSQAYDLMKRLRETYVVTADPAVQGQRNIDPMYLVMQCKHGEIYPDGEDHLAVLVKNIRIAKRMRTLEFLKLVQDCRDAAVFRFSPSDFDLVEKYVLPRRRRHLASEVAKRIGESTAYKKVLAS